jgi:probable O-glycosylation ligase (exosortase A-associated)
MRDLVLLLGCLAMLPAAIRHVHIGVMLWAWSGFLAPADRVWGFMAVVPLNKVFAAVTVLALVFGRDAQRPYLDATMALMLVLLPLGLLSASTAISDSPEVWVMFEKTVKIVLLCFVVTMAMQSRLRLHSLLLAIAVGLGLAGVWEGMAFIASGGSHRVQGLTTLGDNNQFALAILMLLPPLFYLYRQTQGRVARLGLLGALLLSTVSVVAAFSRGGFIGLLVLALGFASASRRSLARLALLAGLAAVLLTLAPPAWFERIGTIGSANQDASFMERIGAWKISLLVALDYPLLGGGFHSVQDPEVWDRYRNAAQTMEFPSTAEIGAAHAPHSIYFEVLSDLGFPGLFLFLGLMASGLWNGRVIRRLAHGDPGLGWARDLASTLQASILVYGVSGAALSMAYFELFYLILAVLSVLRRMIEGGLAHDQKDLAGQQAQVAGPYREVVGQ